MAAATKTNSTTTRKETRIKQIIGRLEKAHPDAKLDLDFANPLELLIALILAAQARDDLVTRLTIHNCCSEIVKHFNGKVPNRLDDLLSLPGVGRKTANILLGNAFGQQTIGVDTHVMRLSQRLGLTKNTNPDKIEFDLISFVPEKQRVRFCHLLQYHGRRVCFAKSPQCPACTIRSLCPYPNKTES